MPPCPLPLRSLGRLAAGLVLAAACRTDGAVPLRADGTVEVREVDVAAMGPGRVRALRVDEGQAVRTGDTLATLTQPALPATLEQARAQLAQAEANLRDLRAGARPAELAQARAALEAAEAEATRAAQDLERIGRLAASRVVGAQQLDAARAAADASRERARAAREALALVREGARPERLRAAEAEVARARGALAALEANAGDLVLTAPADGVILGRHAEPGDMVPLGVPVVTLGVTREPWVRVWFPAPAIARLRPGQRATVRLAGDGERRFEGRITAISPQAEYVTRTALTERERADLLFAVKVAVQDTTGAVKPGLPATVELDAPR